MQKWLIVSDSHGLKDELRKLFEEHKDYKIFHLGDYTINESIFLEYNANYVRGNCDFSRADLEKNLDVDGFKVFITHGHKYNVKSTYVNLYYKALEVGANYAFFGHTHRQSIFVEDNITFINPGSLKDSGSYVEIIDGQVYFKRM